ncbi:MAG: FAD-dependent oxidoreductase [Bradymonadaceae bacterium]|nr:FAD-dependent oxidoreductase [Lujinxingiaceae bacterium]
MHYVIVGNGVAGTTAALAIRKRHKPKHAKITLIGDESDYFFSRTALMYAYMDRLTRQDLEPFERKVYARQAIDLVRERVVDIDAASQTLALGSGKSLSYDKLLLATGAKPRMMPFQGVEKVKEGIVHFVSIQDLDECERLTWSTNQATVIGGGLIGVELAECFHHHKLDVTFLVREPYFWPMALGEEEGSLVSEHIRARGVDLRHDEQLEFMEADAQGRIASISTNQGNKLACQMLAVCIGVGADTAWLKQATSAPRIERGICVNRAFETSLANVYAAGDCAEIDMGSAGHRIETIWYSAKLHGELAAKSMMGDTITYEPPIFYNSSKFFEIEFTTVGEVINVPEGTHALYRKAPGKFITQRIAFDAQRVLGFNMLGSRWDHTVLMRWIAERRDIDYVREHLHEAQFDVEFGRAKLHQMEEKEVVS